MNQDSFPSRRGFVRSAAAASAALALGDYAFLVRLPPVSRQDARIVSDAVRFDSGIEPLVQLLEKTPRDRVLEEFATRIAKGTSYREVLTALLLAGFATSHRGPMSASNFTPCCASIRHTWPAWLGRPEIDGYRSSTPSISSRASRCTMNARVTGH